MTIWRPISKPPIPSDFPHAGLILCIDAEGQWLMPGPVTWDGLRSCWEDEGTDEGVVFDPDVDYYWAHEEDIINSAVSEIAKAGAGGAAKVVSQ